MRFTRSLLLLASCSLAFADVSFTFPVAGYSVPGGTAFTVTWAESGVAPLLGQLLSYRLFLYTGSNAAPIQLTELIDGTVSALSVAVIIDVGLGGAKPANAYFFGISSTGADGTVINYSSRFSITGMTGSFTPDVQSALTTVVGTAGPATVYIPAGVAGGAAGEAEFSIPYNKQSGLTRFAPMQPIPPTSITATNTSPLWPTSSVVVATAFLPIPSIQTTITQAPAANNFASHQNTAAPQPQPTGDMAKFLNRWKD